jgi:hypothetical protein
MPDEASSQPREDYEFIEIQVSKKVLIHLAPDDLINALQEHANALAASKQQVESHVTDRLNQLTQLVHQLRSDLAQLTEPRPPAG